MKQASERTIRVLDLFSGAGGISTGFKQSSPRYEVVSAVENDAVAAATYRENHPETDLYVGGIQDWLKEEEIPESDLIIGGPPCQGFSTLGARDQQDERNQLWLRYAETIRRSRPKYFLLENVPSFLTSVQFERFKRQCQPSGPLGDYTFQAKILNAADYGTAQVRKRVILIGHQRHLSFPGFPVASHSNRLIEGTSAWRTLGDVLEGIPFEVTDTDLASRSILIDEKKYPGVFSSAELHLSRNYQNLSLERFRSIPKGGNRFNIPDRLLPRCWKDHKTGSADVMGRLSFEKPSVTIRTEFFKPEKGRYLHPYEHRAITHFEAARIQGFPDNYKWVGSKTSIARQIGNAVPIPLGAALGSHLLKVV